MRRRVSTIVFVVAFLAHIGILVSALASMGRGLFHDSDVNAANGCDFFAIYVASDNLLHGRGVYDEGPDTAPVPCHYSFRYLPTAAVAATPFALLPPEPAYFAWIAFLASALAFCLWCVWRLTNRDLATFAPVAAVWLLFTPLYLEYRLGQYNLVQTAFVMGALAALRAEKSRAFAGWFAASLAFKLNTWLALPALVRGRKWGAPLIALGVIAITSVPHFLAYPDSLGAFLGNFGVRLEYGFTTGNMGVPMLLGVALPALHTPLTARAAFFAGVAIGLAATWRARRLDVADLVAFWFALALIVYHHTWEHHFIMALPALTLLGLRRRGAAFWIAALLLAAPTIYGFAHGDWSRTTTLIHHAQKPIGVAILLVMTVVEARTHARAAR